MTSSSSKASNATNPAGLGRLLAALVIVGPALRPQVILIGPIVGELQADLGMSHAVAGLLGTIPVLCMGILAPLGPVLAGSIGPRLGVAACVPSSGFGVARAAMPDSATVLLATVGVGVGTAVIGPILPIIVRHRAPSHPAAGTGAYVAGLIPMALALGPGRLRRAEAVQGSPVSTPGSGSPAARSPSGAG